MNSRLTCLGLGLALATLRPVRAEIPVNVLEPASSVVLQRSGVDTPYPDARSALAAARAGDVVLLGPGTHRGPLAVTNSNVTLRGVPGARVNANDANWKPAWTKAPQYGRLAFASPIPFEPGAVSIDDRIMIDARADRGGLALHDGGLGADSRVPLQGVYTYLEKDHCVVVSFADDRDPARHRIEASPRSSTAIAVRDAVGCRVESLIVTGGEVGIGFANTTNSVVERCLVYAVDTGVLLGKGASACRVLSCDLTMNPDALSLDCDQASVGKAVWHAHKQAGTYDKRCVLADQSGENNEVAFNYLYDMWDGVDVGDGVGKEDVEEHYKNDVYKGIARFNRGLRVHHNRLDLANDDALEPGDVLVDHQWYGNLVTRARCAVRFKTISLGPFYFYDNVVLDSGNGLRLYKSMPACANVYIFNNVVRHKTGIIYLKMDSVCWDDPWLASTLPRGTPGFRIYNNALVCETPFASVEGNVAPNFVSDHNLFTAPAAATFPPQGSDVHSLFGAKPTFVDATNGNWRLADGSAGKGAGCPLATFLPSVPKELASFADKTALDMGLLDVPSERRAPLGPTSGLWALAQASISLGERDITQFRLDATGAAPRPLWGKPDPGTLSRNRTAVVVPAPKPPAVQPVGLTGPAGALRNGNFASVAVNGVPTGWDLTGAGALGVEWSEDRLRLTIREATKDQGSIAQTVTGFAPNARLVLTGRVRSSKPGLAYLQVKLKDGKKELERFSSAKSGVEEQELRIEFSSKTATSVSVQCRFSQETAGDAIWLSDLKLEPLAE